MPIHQEVHIDASPAAVFDLLTNSDMFARMTGGRAADISTDVGGAFSMFDGHISGRHVELAPAARVVQAWRSKDWPAGVYSIAKFELTKDGKGTKLVFDQVGHPLEHQPDLESGWVKMYWEPMQALLGAK